MIIGGFIRRLAIDKTTADRANRREGEQGSTGICQWRMKTFKKEIEISRQ